MDLTIGKNMDSTRRNPYNVNRNTEVRGIDNDRRSTEKHYREFETKNRGF